MLEVFQRISAYIAAGIDSFRTQYIVLSNKGCKGAVSAVQSRVFEPGRPEKGQKSTKNRGLPKAGAPRKVC